MASKRLSNAIASARKKPYYSETHNVGDNAQINNPTSSLQNTVKKYPGTSSKGYNYTDSQGNQHYVPNNTSTSTSSSSYTGGTSGSFTDLNSISKPDYVKGNGFTPTYDNSKVNDWAGKLNDLYDQITNRGAFSYDQHTDPLYQQYAEMYQRNAKLAMQDTMGQAAALTGGYGSSYAETAGQSMYNQQMNQLNDKALELRQMAANEYAMEGDRLQQNFANAGNMYAQAYGEMRDNISDQQYAYETEDAQRREYNDYLMNMYGYDLQNASAMNDLNYNIWRANRSDYESDRDYNSDYEKWLAEFNYQQNRDAVSDAQWNKSFDYNAYRDSVSDSQWNKTFDYNAGRDAVADSQWQQQFDYNKYADSRDFDYNAYRDSVADNQWQNTFNYNKSRDAASDYQWQKEFAEQQRQYNSNLAEDQRQFDEQMLQQQAQYDAKYLGMNSDNIVNALEYKDTRRGGEYAFGAVTETAYNNSASLKKQYGSYQKYVDAMLDKNKDLTETEKVYILMQLTT